MDAKTGKLEPLLAAGMVPEAMGRALYAQLQNNGVTGFVAATGKSYLCEDTTEDPLYLEGCKGAKSSLTVPLILHDEVIGTFNVESPEPRAFTESDMQFLEIFTPRRGRRSEYAGIARRRKGHDRRRKCRSDPQRRGPAG